MGFGAYAFSCCESGAGVSNCYNVYVKASG